MQEGCALLAEVNNGLPGVLVSALIVVIGTATMVSAVAVTCEGRVGKRSVAEKFMPGLVFCAKLPANCLTSGTIYVC